MFSFVGDSVSMAGVYYGGSFHPKKFLWRGREYTVDEITMRNRILHNGTRVWMYSIRSKQNLYRFIFDSEKSSWVLEEVWCDG